MLPLRWGGLWMAGGWLAIGFTILTSLWPGGVSLPVPIWDKLQHAAGYALLMLWFVGLYPRDRFLLLALWCTALGVAIEFAQGYLTTTRSMDVFDVVANSTGILIALLLSWLLTGGWALRVERLLSGPQTD